MRLGRERRVGNPMKELRIREKEREVEVEALVLSVDVTVCNNMSDHISEHLVKKHRQIHGLYIHLEQLHDVHMKGTEVGGAD